MADLRPQFSEEVVGHGHPTKTDVTNRAWNVEHDEDGTHKDHIIDSDQYVHGSIDTVHIDNLQITAAKLATDAVETAKIKALNVTNAKLGPDSVDDTKIGDAKVKKEHINTDIRGAGLAGGAGTALSVDGIVEAGSAELKVKIINIGDWNMDTTASVPLVHGLTFGNVRDVTALIRHDNNNTYYMLHRAGYYQLDAVNITLVRSSDGYFDSIGYDSIDPALPDPPGRGWITIWYIV